MVGLKIKLSEAVNEINYTVCTTSLGWQPWLCIGVQFHFPYYVFIEDAGCPPPRRRSLLMPSAMCPGRWLRPPSLLGNYSRAAELIAAQRAVEQGFRNP